MRSVESGRILLSHAERNGAIYDLSRPEDQISDGEVLELVDFRNAARSVGAAIGLGTEVFKNLIHSLTGPHDPYNLGDCPDLDPFCNIHRLPGDKSLKIFKRDITIELKLTNYFLETQAYKDLLDKAILMGKRNPIFGPKSLIVAREVIYEDGIIEELTEPLR